MTYSSRMSRENSKMMAGIADRTVSKYLHVLEEAMDEYMKQRVQAGDMLLGGDGKVVEIDEKELTINKNHKGRIPPKKITIFGMVEIDAPILRIEDVRLRTGVRKQEEKNKEKKRRKKRRRRDLRRQVPDETAFVPTAIQMEVEDGDGVNVCVRPTRPTRTDEEREAISLCIKELTEKYEQSKNGKHRKAPFFIVSDRSHDTLIPLIQKHVAGGSMIFTDEFATYQCLRELGFRHYTVCHKYEFCHFVIEGPDIIRVCTNHIERLWIEVDRTLAHMSLEKTLRCLNIESYRQLRLFEEDAEQNLIRLLSDIAEVWRAIVATPVQDALTGQPAPTVDA